MCRKEVNRFIHLQKLGNMLGHQLMSAELEHNRSIIQCFSVTAADSGCWRVRGEWRAPRHILLAGGGGSIQEGSTHCPSQIFNTSPSDSINTVTAIFTDILQRHHESALIAKHHGNPQLSSLHYIKDSD